MPVFLYTFCRLSRHFFIFFLAVICLHSHTKLFDASPPCSMIVQPRKNVGKKLMKHFMVDFFYQNFWPIKEEETLSILAWLWRNSEISSVSKCPWFICFTNKEATNLFLVASTTLNEPNKFLNFLLKTYLFLRSKV